MTKESKAEALHKIISDYGAEFRGEAFVPVMISFTALTFSFISLVGSGQSELLHEIAATMGLFLFKFTGGVVAATLLVVMWRRILGWRAHEIARSIVIESDGHRVALIREWDMRNLRIITPRPEFRRRQWLIRRLQEDGRYGVQIRRLRLTSLQAASVERILNGDSSSFTRGITK